MSAFEDGIVRVEMSIFLYFFYIVRGFSYHDYARALEILWKSMDLKLSENGKTTVTSSFISRFWDIKAQKWSNHPTVSKTVEMYPPPSQVRQRMKEPDCKASVQFHFLMKCQYRCPWFLLYI